MMESYKILLLIITEGTGPIFKVINVIILPPYRDAFTPYVFFACYVFHFFGLCTLNGRCMLSIDGSATINDWRHIICVALVWENAASLFTSSHCVGFSLLLLMNEHGVVLWLRHHTSQHTALSPCCLLGSRKKVEKSKGLKDLHKSKTFEKPLAKRLSKVHNPTGKYSGIKYL
jgi:hypothetical protein